MTATATALTATTTAIDDALQTPSAGAGRSWTCNACKLSFSEGKIHRVHMKSPWQYCSPFAKITAIAYAEVVFTT